MFEKDRHYHIKNLTQQSSQKPLNSPFTLQSCNSCFYLWT